MARTAINEFLFPAELARFPGASGDVGRRLGARGVWPGAVVVVADRMVHDTGLTAALLSGLTDAGFVPHVFSDITGEPNLEMVESATALAAETDAAAYVGIGGGSALDIAKLVAYHAATRADLRETKGFVAPVSGLRPLVMIPTTVGTGAEATRVAMFSVDGAKRAVVSNQFVPQLAVLDDDLVQGLPAPVVAATALDALSHAIEAMMSTSSNELTWMFSGEAARRVFASLPAAFDGDSTARAELLYASFLAGVGLNAGVVLGHSMSYVLAARHHLAHGVGCALALPYCLAYNQGMPASDATALAESVLGRSGAGLREVADAAHALTTRVGVPTDLTAFGTSLEEIPMLAATVASDYPRPTNPVPLESGRVAELLRYLRLGDLPGAWTAMGA